MNDLEKWCLIQQGLTHILSRYIVLTKIKKWKWMMLMCCLKLWISTKTITSIVIRSETYLMTKYNTNKWYTGKHHVCKNANTEIHMHFRGYCGWAQAGLQARVHEADQGLQILWKWWRMHIQTTMKLIPSISIWDYLDVHTTQLSERLSSAVVRQ